MRLAAALEHLGTESAFEVLARATALARSGRSVINLGIGQPDFPTPPNIVEAAVRALREGHHGYTPANGILPLREAVAEDMLARRGVAVDPDRVVVVPGGKVTMAFAVLMFGEPGAKIMYPDPGFPIYRSLIEYTGAEPVPIALHEAKGFAFSAEEVLARITPRTRLIIVNSPANPTGGVVPQAETDALARGLERFPDVAVLSDEILYLTAVSGRSRGMRPGQPERDVRPRVCDVDGALGLATAPLPRSDGIEGHPCGMSLHRQGGSAHGGASRRGERHGVARHRCIERQAGLRAPGR